MEKESGGGIKMYIIPIMLCFIGINLIINIFIIMYMLKELVDLQDKSNEILVKHIGFIYDIINFNNLKRPPENDKKI